MSGAPQGPPAAAAVSDGREAATLGLQTFSVKILGFTLGLATAILIALWTRIVTRRVLIARPVPIDL